MKIACFEIEEWESCILRQACCAEECAIVKEPLNVDNAVNYANAEIISCFIYSDLSAPVLKHFKNLKLIATRSTGFDHIDLDYCDKNGIAVANVPAYGEHTVAEHVFALLLSLSRHMPQALQQTREGNFSLQGLRGFDLCGKTIGIVGTGKIGLKTAEIAKGFGMTVIAHDAYPRTNTGFSYVSLEELLKKSDIVSLHVPGTPKTHHMISDKEFSLMKDGVIVINTARGSVIDVKTLLRALNSGKVGAAGLDVLPEEPAIREEAELLRGSFAEKHDLEVLLTDHALLHHKNVFVTPHSAFYTKEAVEKILHDTSENIRFFIEGKPQNIVNKPQKGTAP